MPLHNHIYPRSPRIYRSLKAAESRLRLVSRARRPNAQGDRPSWRSESVFEVLQPHKYLIRIRININININARINGKSNEWAGRGSRRRQAEGAGVKVNKLTKTGFMARSLPSASMTFQCLHKAGYTHMHTHTHVCGRSRWKWRVCLGLANCF